MLHFPIVERCNEAGAQTLVHHRQQYEHRNEGSVDDAIEVDPRSPYRRAEGLVSETMTWLRRSLHALIQL